MRSLLRMGGPGPVLLVLLASFALGQGTGNNRDLVLRSSVQAGTATDAAKLILTNDLLTVNLLSPAGGLVGAPAILAADLRLRTDVASALQLPGEPGVCGLGPAMLFLVEGTGTLPALFPGTATIATAGNSFSLIIPDLTTLGPISVWVQGATFDPGAPNGLAFTRTIRHDTDLLSTRTSFTAPPQYGGSLFTGYGLAAADVDQDGNGDILIGIPGAPVGGLPGAGEVRVLFGPDQLQALVLHAPVPQAYAQFGNFVRCADLNGDGVPDIVVGDRLEDVNGLTDAGAVYVFFGPTFALSQRLVAPVPEGGARFGHIVAFTDWDGDGHPDLVVGAPKATSGGVSQAGQVHVYHAPTLSLLATLDNPLPQIGSKFGYGLCGVDLDRDGDGDLVVGIPYHDVFANDDTGLVVMYYGGSTAPVGFISHPLDATAVFGHVIAAADLDGDGWTDLAIGAEFDDHAAVDAGAVHIVYGPDFSAHTVVVSPQPMVSGGFGSDLAIGDVNHDGHPDLVVGAFYHDVNGLPHAGECVVRFGPTFEQFMALVPPNGAAYAEAGRRVACGDLNGDGFADVVYTAWLASPGGPAFNQAGEVYIVR